MVQDAEKFKEEDEANYKEIEAKNKYESYIYNVSGSLTKEVKEKMSEEDVETIESTIKNHKDWLESHPDSDANDYDDKMKECEDIVQPTITKLSKQAGGGMPGGMPWNARYGMPGGMPGGMPDCGSTEMPQAPPTVEEVD